ncbi:neuronal acetylcholine receptor subunit alpha-7-like [Pecten maximus]|uniref:neuronal acetylcholine receptor subunit alpha-7-like n=1 Tax=Pecten maximus TaxID=6579 RepID=UPI001458CF83|nr:neuronal acetylcholine receptor subunit alpha-7-like [Pecten maximus]
MHGDLTRLHQHLMTNYSTKFRPTLNLSEPTKVNIGFYLLSLKEFEEKKSKFSIVGFFAMFWHDFQLEWNPDDFGGIDRMMFSQNEVWKPDILLLNPFEKIEPQGFDKLKVLVSKEGYVFWSPLDVYDITCPADVTYYPFDQQTCSFYFSMYMYSVFEVFLEPERSEIDMYYYTPNTLWEMKVANTHVSTIMASQTLSLTMVFQRRPMFQVINTIVPFCILGLLNIMVFLLPAESGERVGFSVTVLLAIAVFMTIVADTLPGTSEPSFPRLCYLLIAELGINMLVTICTILVLRLHHKPQHQKIPSWLTYIICKSFWGNIKETEKQIEENNKHLNRENNIRNETAVTKIQEFDGAEIENKRDHKCNCNGNGMMQTKRKHIYCETSWQDVAKFLDVFFFVLFILIFGSSKIAAYFIFT